MTAEKSIPNISQAVADPCEKCEFDKAMDMTGFGRYNLQMSLLCMFIGFALVLETIGLSYVLPASQCDLGLSLTQKGILGGIPFVGLMLSSHTWGYLADIYGRRKMLLISMFVGSACSMLSSLSPNLIVFGIMRLLSSALLAATNAIIFAYYGEFTPSRFAATMMSILSSTFIFSTALSTLIAWGVLSWDISFPIGFLGIDFRAWRLLVFVYAFPFTLSALCLLQVPESPKFLMSINKEKEALEILRNMYSVNSGKHPSTYPVYALTLHELGQNDKKKSSSLFKSMAEQTFPLFKPPLLKYTLMFFVINFGVYSCANSFYMWMPYIIDKFYIGLDSPEAEGKKLCELIGAGNEMISTIQNASEVLICNDRLNDQLYPSMILFSCIVGLANVIVAYVLRFFHKKLILLFIFGIASLSSFLVHFVQNPIFAWTLIVIFNFVGVLMGVVNAYIVELYPTQYRSMGVSLLLMFGRVGSISGTNIIGQLIDNLCPATFFLYSGITLACFINSLFLPRKHTNDKKEVTAM